MLNKNSESKLEKNYTSNHFIKKLILTTFMLENRQLDINRSSFYIDHFVSWHFLASGGSCTQIKSMTYTVPCWAFYPKVPINWVLQDSSQLCWYWSCHSRHKTQTHYCVNCKPWKWSPVSFLMLLKLPVKQFHKRY